jgi:hypothetical protein
MNLKRKKIRIRVPIRMNTYINSGVKYNELLYIFGKILDYNSKFKTFITKRCYFLVKLLIF